MNVYQLLQNAVDSKPVEFAETFNALIRERAAQAIDARRIEVAKGLYGAPQGSQNGRD